METIPCNLCGTHNYEFAYSQPDTKFANNTTFTTVRCRTCGMGFINPRPTFEEMGQFYPKEFYEYFEIVEHAGRYANEASYLASVRGVDGPPRLLDVGCARGDFPRLMATKGWIVEGVEPFANVPIDDFPVFRQPLPELAGRDGEFDAVTAWAVIEHVHDPLAYFEKAAALLRPGGVFVFLVTNFEAMASRYLFGEDPPRHLYLFTRTSIGRYLERVGLELEKADLNDRIYQMTPRGWLAFAIKTWVQRRPFEFEDLPPNFSDFLRTERRSASLGALLGFVRQHPIAAIDRLGRPVVARLEILLGRYGIATYVARKPL